MEPNSAVLVFGKNLEVRVDPANVTLFGRAPDTALDHKAVDFFGRSKLPKKMCKPLLIPSRNIVQPGDWDLNVTQLEESEVYRQVFDIYTNRHDYRKSSFYQEAAERVVSGQIFRYKEHQVNTIEDVDRIFETHLIRLLESLEKDGYQESSAKDVGRMMIGRAGEFIKGIKGRHRFAAVRIVGVNSVPLRIVCIHSEFVKKHGLFRSGRIDPERLRSALEAVGSFVGKLRMQILAIYV